MTTTIKGLDVSHYQDDIDFIKVKADGYKFVIMKATEGTYYKDVMFETNYRKAMAAGMQVGAYHYGKFSTVAEAKAEAKYFLSVLGGRKMTYPVALDLEENKKGASPAVLTDAAIAFMEMVEAQGYAVMLYTYKSFSYDQKRLIMSKFKPYILWMARYNSYLGVDTDLWQHSSTGKVSGIKGNVDLNVAYKDFSGVYPRAVKAVSETGVSQVSHIVPTTYVSKSKVKYTVKAGDTLTKIANKYKTTVSKLVKLNKLKDKDIISVGQTLTVGETVKKFYNKKFDRLVVLNDKITLYKDKELTKKVKTYKKGTKLTITGIVHDGKVPRFKTAKGYVTANKEYVKAYTVKK
ncbi:GH25 family lysozyme [Rummeliibacillus stabekisii]|uniref:GH25 family lysozyme n=1 Tax=Rummeliibacillus stabekisii TaxID=241244 RepID=UPI003718A13E